MAIPIVNMYKRKFGKNYSYVIDYAINGKRIRKHAGKNTNTIPIGEEKLKFKDNSIFVSPFVLPHHSKFKSDEASSLA